MCNYPKYRCSQFYFFVLGTTTPQISGKKKPFSCWTYFSHIIHNQAQAETQFDRSNLTFETERCSLQGKHIFLQGGRKET